MHRSQGFADLIFYPHLLCDSRALVQTCCCVTVPLSSALFPFQSLSISVPPVWAEITFKQCSMATTTGDFSVKPRQQERRLHTAPNRAYSLRGHNSYGSAGLVVEGD